MSRLPFLTASALILASSTSLTFAAPKVVASIKPVHALLSAVMGDVATPDLIVEGAGTPHAYSLKPSQARKLQEADLIVWIGHDLEVFLEKSIETVAENASLLELMDVKDLQLFDFREGGTFDPHMHDEDNEHADHDDHDKHDEDHDDHAKHEDHNDHAKHDDHDDHKDRADDGHEGHAHGSTDPHIWLSPENAKLITMAMAEQLAAIDPANAQTYNDNSVKLVAEIDQLKTDISTEIAAAQGKAYFVFHDGYRYFEEAFRIPASGAITLTPDVSPGAERIRDIQARLAEFETSCVFAEPQSTRKVIDVVIEGTDVEVAMLDPLGSDLQPGPNLYVELMRNLSSTMTNCLTR